MNRPQQSEHGGPCQVQEAEEGASNQPECRHVLNAKQREVRGLEQLRWKLEKLRLLLLFPRFPSPLSSLEGSETRTGKTKQEQQAPSEEKGHDAPFPITGFLLQLAELGSGPGGEARSLAQLLRDFYLLVLDISTIKLRPVQLTH